MAHKSTFGDLYREDGSLSRAVQCEYDLQDGVASGLTVGHISGIDQLTEAGEPMTLRTEDGFLDVLVSKSKVRQTRDDSGEWTSLEGLPYRIVIIGEPRFRPKQ
jgi:hypothetical protein